MIKGSLTGTQLPASLGLNELQADIDALANGGSVGLMAEWSEEGTLVAIHYETADDVKNMAAVTAAISAHTASPGQDEATVRAAVEAAPTLMERIAALEARVADLENDGEVIIDG